MANVEVFAEEKEGMDEALRRINLIAYPPTAEVGETYEGKVKNIVAFGAFLEILPGVDALLHISEIAHERVEKAEERNKKRKAVRECAREMYDLMYIHRRRDTNHFFVHIDRPDRF